ncbi:MAG: hypothetical protein P8Z75_16370 [Gammaproteobacteria bacterium]
MTAKPTRLLPDSVNVVLVPEASTTCPVCGDRARVGDAGIRRVRTLGEHIVARHEIAVTDVLGGGHQALHVQAGTGAEEHPVWVYQKNLAVRFQTTEDVRRVAANHPVQYHRRAIGLAELHILLRPDRELLPVDDRLLALLIDHRVVRVRRIDRRRSTHHLTTAGICQRRHRQQPTKAQTRPEQWTSQQLLDHECQATLLESVSVHLAIS